MVRKAQIYPPVSDWRPAEPQFQSYPLKNGEFTVVVNSMTGRSYDVVACDHGQLKQTSYIDGGDISSIKLTRVSSQELYKRSPRSAPRGRKK